PTVRKNFGKDQQQTKKQVVEFVGLVPKGVSIGKWLSRQIEERTDVDWDVCRKLMKEGPKGNAFHITLAHISATKDVSLKAIYDGYVQALRDEKRDNIRAQCQGDYIVCNGEVMALRVKTMAIKEEEGIPDAVTKCIQSSNEEEESRTVLVSTNAIPHITLCVGPDAKPVQSNDMLKVVFGPDNSDSPLNCPSGWTVIPVTLAFNAVVQKFMTKN
ncbi:hypothetical protein GGI22_008035, partial [Coemansia erecta]